jgi:hypothetical protein
MGLDAHCGSYSMGMGSYSGVHQTRKMLVQLTIAYCKGKLTEQQSHEDADQTSGTDSEIETDCTTSEQWRELMQQLEAWLTPQSELERNQFASVISYADVALTSDDDLAVAGLLGLKWFVDHSDCDGYWSPGQCFDILRLMKELASTSDENGRKLVVEHVNGESSLYWGLLETSLSTNKPVVFC